MRSSSALLHIDLNLASYFHDGCGRGLDILLRCHPTRDADPHHCLPVVCCCRRPAPPVLLYSCSHCSCSCIRTKAYQRLVEDDWMQKHGCASAAFAEERCEACSMAAAPIDQPGHSVHPKLLQCSPCHDAASPLRVLQARDHGTQPSARWSRSS